MKKVLLIKYGELTTKKDNRSFFLKKLEKNIKEVLNDIDYEIEYDFFRMFIYTKEEEKVIEKLQKVFGIYEIVEAYELDNNDIENIKEETLNILKEEKFKTFKIETKRSIKTYPINSMEISKLVGGHILKNIEDIKVDVNTPDILFNIEVRSDKAYLYFKTHIGLKGYPVGCAGRALLMLSGGIDSPVAGFLASKRGVSLDYIYFDSPPHTSVEAKNKVKDLSRKLNEYNLNGKLYVVNFTKIQEEILKNIPHNYLITIMRRMMYKICEELCIRNNYLAIFNGENISQVASQTLTSMKAINQIIRIPVIRPLACFEKLEIINIAKQIDTYEISTLPYEDCCTVFVPKHPVINPDLEKIKEYEKFIDVESLVKEAIDNIYEEDLSIEKNSYL